MVHLREIEGSEIILGNQGDLFLNAMTWYDHGTGSVWSQPFGEAIMGPLAGTKLDLLPSTLTTWEAWRAAHPDTLGLMAPTYVSGYDLDLMAIVVELGGEQIAFPVPELRTVGVANEELLDVPIAVVIDPDDPDRWSVLERRAGDQVVELTIESGRLVDQLTGTEFDPVRGLAMEGPLLGESLGILPGFTSFPRDYVRLFPDGRMWTPEP